MLMYRQTNYDSPFKANTDFGDGLEVGGTIVDVINVSTDCSVKYGENTFILDIDENIIVEVSVLGPNGLRDCRWEFHPLKDIPNLEERMTANDIRMPVGGVIEWVMV